MHLAKTFWRTKAIVDSARRHGLWSAFRLTALLTRGLLRDHFGHHQKSLVNIWFVLMFAAGIAIAFYLGQGIDHEFTPGRIWGVAVLLATSLVCLFLPLGKLCLSGIFHNQLWFYCLGAWLFAVFLGGFGYFFFDAWNNVYAQNPASAVLLGIIAGGVAIGFQLVFSWFVRGLLKPGHHVMEPSELAGLNEEGRRRVCIHEAGHALCYGLCEGIPEDATVGIDPDASSLMMGVVTLPTPRDPTEVSKSLLEWKMLILMAGVAAERHFLGEDSVCGSGDMAAMNNIASVYLLAGYGDVYIHDAKADEEVTANRAAIKRMRDKYSAKADSLIRLNSEQCEKLADHIDKVEYMGCEDIAQMVVSRVKNPEKKPRLRWAPSIILCSGN